MSGRKLRWTCTACCRNKTAIAVRQQPYLVGLRDNGFSHQKLTPDPGLLHGSCVSEWRGRADFRLCASPKAHLIFPKHEDMAVPRECGSLHYSFERREEWPEIFSSSEGKAALWMHPVLQKSKPGPRNNLSKEEV